MLGTALATLAKTDLSRLDAGDVGRFASILRDSAAFDAQKGLRRGRKLARRGTAFAVDNPRQTGLGLGGVALVGLLGFAAYKVYASKRPEIEAAVEDAKDAAVEMAEDVKAQAQA